MEQIDPEPFIKMYSKDPDSFKEIEHTADAGLEIKGQSLNQLFANAAYGFLHLILTEDEYSRDKGKSIVLEADNISDLLIDWLNELNYILNVERFITSEVSALNVDDRQTPYKLKATVRGHFYSSIADLVQIEIKAITYHQIFIQKVDQGFMTRIYFDI